MVEVDINPDGQIWVDRHGVDLAMIGVMGPQVVMSLICTVAAMSDRVVTPTAPILEATLPDGSRFHATIPPITTAPAIAIRKHLSQALTLDDYVRQGVMTREQCERLRRAVAHRENIIVAGGTGSGKTTLTNALIEEIGRVNPGHRLLILEDTPEIVCHNPNRVAKAHHGRGRHAWPGPFQPAHEPDRSSSVRYAAARPEALIRAWNTGHPGGWPPCIAHRPTPRWASSRNTSPTRSPAINGEDRRSGGPGGLH